MPVNDQSELSRVHTTCKGCVFAEKEGSVQTGCLLGLVSAHRERGEDAVVEAEDQEEQFFVINGRQCPAKRTQAWVDKWVGYGHQMGTSLTHDLMATVKVKQELTQKVDLVILLDESSLHSEPEKSLEQLTVTLDGVKAMGDVNAVHVLSDQDAIHASKVVAVLQSSGLPCPWFITQVMEKDEQGRRYGWMQAVDRVASKLTGHFYVLCRVGDTPPADLSKALTRAVIDRLETFKVLLPAKAGATGLTVARGFHTSSLVMGNHPISAAAFDGPEDHILEGVETKAIFLAASGKAPNLVSSLERVLAN